MKVWTALWVTSGWSLMRKLCVSSHLSLWTKQSTVSIKCSVQYGENLKLTRTFVAELAQHHLSIVSGTKNIFLIFVCRDFVLLKISSYLMCIFQYTTAVMFVFIVLFMVVLILFTAVPPLRSDVFILTVVSQPRCSTLSMYFVYVLGNFFKSYQHQAK